MVDQKAERGTSAPSQDESDKALAVPVGAGAAVACVAGLVLRNLASSIEPQLSAISAKIASERSREAVQRLAAEKQDLDFKMSLELSIGTGLLLLGASALVAAGLVYFRGTPMRRAAALLFPACLVMAVYATIMSGVESLAVTGFGSIALLAYVTSGPNPRARRELEAFRSFPTRVEVLPQEGAHPYRADYLKAVKVEVQKRLRSVSSLPPELANLLPKVGEGRPVGYFQLKKNLAYVAVVEADAYSVSDFVTVVMALEEAAPRFVLRPLPIVEGRRIKNTGIKFKDDPEFTEEFLIEAAPGAASDPQAVREFLSEEVRDSLFELPRAWLVVEKNAMSLTVYGAFDADVADKLVETADVLFAEHGAEGGPSLFEPDGAVDPRGKTASPKKKKKKKAAESSASSAP